MSRKIRRKGFIFLIQGILLLWLAILPVLATDAFPIQIDGNRLFSVEDSGNYSAQQRANEANQVLEKLKQREDFVSLPINVTIDNSRELPIIRVNDAHFLTVTSQDTPDGRTVLEQAETWANKLKIGLEKAKFERSRRYLLRATLIALGLLGLAFIFSWKIGDLWQRWIFPKLPKLSQPTTGSPLHPPTSPPPQPFIGLHLLARLSLFFLRCLIWGGTILYVSQLFAQTRLLSQKIINVVSFSLFSDVLPLGNQAYSILDLFILAGLMMGMIGVGQVIKEILRSRILNLTGLNRGSQDAIAQIANYSLVFIGAIVILQVWGLDLSSLTVFASVLGVGIGLGLQGIAREFVSGLVLIFERPIQVGDFVEVGSSMGTVERIGVRSTEIRTLTQISIILPNSRFLDTEVINWSHPSPVSCLRITIKVAYGSDLSLVREILLEIAHKHPDILSDPPPDILFTDFGESALNLQLLAWVSRPHRQFRVKSDLYFQIDAQFREHHIEIPFPQRDLNLRLSEDTINQLLTKTHDSVNSNSNQ